MGPAAPGSVRGPAMSLVHRRTPLLAALAALSLLAAYLAVAGRGVAVIIAAR